MEEEFVPYTESLALRELGFDEPCFGLWNLNNGKHEVDVIGVCKYSKEFKYREVLAPLFQQAFRWFRDNHGLIGLPRRDPSRNYNGWWFEIFEQKIKSDNPISLDDSDYINFETYEEAELACLRKLIEIVKKNKL
jgi:hypothetical protein